MTQQRIPGFDLARAYAIFGMFIVNFNTVFGDYHDPSLLGKALVLFSGNSSTLFVMLAGMGMALMTRRGKEYAMEDRKRLLNILFRRAAFLLVFGLLFCCWWPADILHAYGGYMGIGALLVFLDKKYFLWAAVLAAAVFHVLLFLIPFEKGWDFNRLQYLDFWSFRGFFRSWLYNGWNPVFPWLAYFCTGMYLGRLNWQQRRTKVRVFRAGLLLFGSVSLVQWAAPHWELDARLLFFLNADYVPPFLPFVLSTVGFGLMAVVTFLYLGERLGGGRLIRALVVTGQMTFTHYVAHLSLGLVLFSVLRGGSVMGKGPAVAPVGILLFAMGYFVFSAGFSSLWAKRFRQGPLETLMRKVSG